MKLRFLFIIISFVTLWSCNISEKEPSYIDSINRLEIILDSTANRYLALDTSKIFEAYERINSNLIRYNDLDAVVNDSVKVYAAFQKSFKRFISEHSLIMDEISYSRDQLQSLKDDIRNNKISKEQMENYYNDEKDAVGVLIHKISFNTQNITYQLKSFSQLNDSVEMIIKRLEGDKK